MPTLARRCPAAGCPNLTAGGRCPIHAAEAEKVRGNRHKRGYDAEYVRARDAAVATATHCAKCGTAFTPDNPATGGHIKDRRRGGTTKDGIQAECRRCNLGWAAPTPQGDTP